MRIVNIHAVCQCGSWISTFFPGRVNPQWETAGKETENMNTEEKIKIFYNTIEKYQKDKESFRQELEILDRLKTKIGRSIIKKEGIMLRSAIENILCSLKIVLPKLISQK